MNARHLTIGGEMTWCDTDDLATGTDDPQQATCTTCLRMAASYGAAACMRCAAVEAGGGSDPELERERDKAIEELQKHRRATHTAGFFVCAECGDAKKLEMLGYHVGTQGWCKACMILAQRAQR